MRAAAGLPAPAAPPPPIPANAPSADLGRAVLGEGIQAATKIRQTAASAAASIRATAQAQIAQFHTAQALHSAAIEGQASASHEAIAGHEHTAATELHSGARSAQASVSAAGQEASGQVQQGGAQQEQRAPETGNQAGSDFDSAAAAENARFQQSSASRTTQVQGTAGGGDDTAAAQAEASAKIGGQATENFAKDATKVQSETQHAASEFKGHVQQGVSRFQGAIGEAVPRITSGISGLVDTARGGFGETAEHAASSASAFAGHVTDQLSTAAAAAQRYLASGVEATVNSFRSIAERYATEVEQRGVQLADAVAQRAHTAGTAIAQAPAGQARPKASQVRTQIQDAAAQSATALGGMNTLVGGGLAKHGAAASAEMAKATVEAGHQFRTVAGQAEQKLAQAQSQVTQQLAIGAQVVGQQARQTAADAVRELERHSAEFGSRVQQGTQQARQQLSGAVDKAASEQQGNLATFQSRKTSASSEIASQYSSLQSQADSRSRAEQQQTDSKGQPFLDWILPASWTKAIKNWFADTFGKWFGGFLYGLISALIGVLIVVALLAIIAAVFTPFVALVVGIVILVAAAAYGIYARFKMFEAYNGRGPGFWEGVGLVCLGILDVTGLPQIIEGIVGYRAFSNGHKMDDFEAGENVGSGIVQLIAIIFAIRGAKGAVKPGDVKPPEVKPPDVKPPDGKPSDVKPPDVKPPAPEYDPTTRSALDLNLDTDPTPRAGETPEQAQARAQAAREELARRGEMPMCFVAGTLVQTPAGAVPIETLVAGQEVLARGEAATIGAYRVLHCMRGRTRTLYQIEILGDHTFTTTRNHPFFVAGKGWTIARDLKVGDPLIALNGTSAPVTAISRERLDQPVATFNLHVEGAASYFVGDGLAVWVHNADPKDPIFNTPLIWGFGASGPRQRMPVPADPSNPNPAKRLGDPGDVDGASGWRTNSADEAGRFLGARATEGGKGNHGAISDEQLAAKDLIAVKTPGRGAAANAGVEHVSIRPRSNPDPSVPLTEAEMADVKAKLESLEPVAKAKAKDFGCG